MPEFVSADTVRAAFAAVMSDMYRAEVPLYGDLIEIVAAANAAVLDADLERRMRMTGDGEIERLVAERHGAIRVGTPAELRALRRIFAVMGMVPVGYYDLAVAGVPVHSTAFRPIDEAALRANPFRVFTSLLRLELIEDEDLRERAANILASRRIVSDRAMALVEAHEAVGGLTAGQAEHFVTEVLEIFRWHDDATVDLATYERLHDAHRLIADVVSFRGPHINHLTPRTLDIDAAQAAMQERGIDAKAVIEGPPRRAVPILLRQTSFKALEETTRFRGSSSVDQGTHTARFGEIEQRGAALTPKGRAMYDHCLREARGTAGSAAGDYAQRLADAFAEFPDDIETLRREGLAYFRYSLAEGHTGAAPADLDQALATGQIVAEPILYEDFLPVSAAGIFQSNLGGAEQAAYAAQASQRDFENAMGAPVLDAFALYADVEQASLRVVAAAFDPLVAGTD